MPGEAGTVRAIGWVSIYAPRFYFIERIKWLSITKCRFKLKLPLSGCSDATTPTPATTNKGPFSNVWRGSRILYRTPPNSPFVLRKMVILQVFKSRTHVDRPSKDGIRDSFSSLFPISYDICLPDRGKEMPTLTSLYTNTVLYTGHEPLLQKLGNVLYELEEFMNVTSGSEPYLILES